MTHDLVTAFPRNKAWKFLDYRKEVRERKGVFIVDELAEMKSVEGIKSPANSYINLNPPTKNSTAVNQ